MAHYKVGKKYLSDDEYEVHLDETWGGILFVISAVLVGVLMHNITPDDWEKYIRFALIMVPAIVAGLILNYLAPFIRVFAYSAVFAGIVSLIVYGVWTAI